MKILIDNGHGVDTKGKRSPDGRLLEYLENRIIARGIVDALTARGLDASLLVPEETDISLPERCRRVNEWCRQLGRKNVILIPIHCNAAGKGDRWYNATGWCAYTTPKDTPADRLATCLYNAAQIHIPDQRLRMDLTDGDPDIEAAFYLLRHTTCPSVLTENLFMDNHADVEYLLSDIGQVNLVNLPRHRYQLLPGHQLTKNARPSRASFITLSTTVHPVHSVHRWTRWTRVLNHIQKSQNQGGNGACNA